MEWCSEDFKITNFARFCQNLQLFLIFFEYCPFLSLTINTRQRSFLSLADELHDKNQETKKCSLNILFTAKCGKFSFEFCTFIFFLHDLVTNKARKLKVVESNLIMKKNSYLSLSELVGVSFPLFLAHVLPRFLSLSLFNTFVDFSGCYVA